jgi:hypothetical protein
MRWVATMRMVRLSLSGVSAEIAKLEIVVTMRNGQKPPTTANRAKVARLAAADAISTARRSPLRSASWAISGLPMILVQPLSESRMPISAAVLPLSASQTGQNGSPTPTKRKIAT